MLQYFGAIVLIPGLVGLCDARFEWWRRWRGSRDGKSAKAKVSPRLRVLIYRHHSSFETVVILRGMIRWIFYDENGNETERVLLDANGENRMLVVEKDRWHSLECLESGSVLFESKDGAYEPLGEGDILTK